MTWAIALLLSLAAAVAVDPRGRAPCPGGGGTGAIARLLSLAAAVAGDAGGRTPCRPPAPPANFSRIAESTHN